MVNSNMDMISMLSDVIAIISEVNLVAVDNGEKLYMGNSTISNIKGEGDVIMKMTSQKDLKLTNVLYVAEIRKNLMSGWLWNKFGFRLVFESDKIVLSKNQMYVGKGYAVNEGHQWKEAITSEIDSILQNHTWELVDLPPGCKPLGYKWIFKKKMKADDIIDKYKARLVYRLVKSLYGLKQAPKRWHQKFDHAMLESGFKINECDSNDKMINSTKDMLKSKFDMKDMGLADAILGIKIIRTQNGLELSQAHYVNKILNTHNAGDSGQARTPIDTSTRPDLAYAISRLSRYTSNPSAAHWKAMTSVLHYLRYSRDYRLHYDRYPAVIEGYRVISIDYVKSKDNIADPLTKGLRRELVSTDIKEMDKIKDKTDIKEHKIGKNVKAGSFLSNGQ
ncbi:zinc finger, CCHC-type containing protein [Tanacetum coccineum]